MLHDYVAQLRATNEELRDSRAVLAQAQQAIDQSDRLRAERAA